MSKSILRVVFDTNAFAPGHFDVLECGPLLQLCKQGRIVPVFGHVFMEETLRAYGVEKRRKDLLELWLPFFAKIVDRVCEDFVTIWHRELVLDKGSNADIFMELDKQKSLMSGLTNLAADGTWHGWNDSQADRDIDAAKRDGQHEAMVAMRKDIADWRGSPEGSVQGSVPMPSLDAFIASEIDRLGREIILANIACQSPNRIAERWAGDKRKYPYVTTFVQNMLFLSHLAMVNHNAKLDLNAQPDLDLMTHLLRADLVVSNETRFLPVAFDALWRPKGKELLTSEQFGRLIDAM
jgi:hypothetical protein